MKSLHITVLFFLFSMAFNYARAQTTTDNNNPGTNKYIGYNGAQDLELKTNDDTHLLMRQNGFSLINGFLIDRSGFVGISQDPSFFSGHEPFSLLHL